MHRLMWLGLVAATMLIANVFSSVPSNAQNDEASALNQKVIELYSAGKYAEAIALAQRALAIREKALGADHPDVATSLNNLALLYKNQGRYADAEPLYKRSLAIYGTAVGRDQTEGGSRLKTFPSLYIT